MRKSRKDDLICVRVVLWMLFCIVTLGLSFPILNKRLLQSGDNAMRAGEIAGHLMSRSHTSVLMRGSPNCTRCSKSGHCSSTLRMVSAAARGSPGVSHCGHDRFNKVVSNKNGGLTREDAANEGGVDLEELHQHVYSELAGLQAARLWR